jgi:NAD(P)-dependent dehydrogenase (short-subunit alcohol dehydrogenase family)
MSRLEGKTALVTGGTTGIGFATAKLFQQEGARVAVTGRGEEGLKHARAELGPAALVVRSDAANLEDLDALMAKVKTELGGLDVLFANAGIGEFAPFERVDEAGFDRQFAVNVKGLYFTVQKALPLLRAGASVILNASVAASNGMESASVYSATKAAVRSFGRTLARELAPRGIRVNTISPGPIRTPIFGKLGMSPDQVEEFQKQMASQVALKRMGNPEEIAETALFLATTGTYLVGAELIVDGGMVEL